MATRMATEDMVGACADIDNAGFWSVECWGGATYDACIRFLNEDPWERLRTFRTLMPNTRFPNEDPGERVRTSRTHMPNRHVQMLRRGHNLWGYRHYGDDVVDHF